jgi:hypothetical protein
MQTQRHSSGQRAFASRFVPLRFLRLLLLGLLCLPTWPAWWGLEALAMPPPNDLCSGAEVIPASGPFPYLSAVTADISGATTTSDPPLPSCLVGSVSRSIWYTFTPATTATYTFSSCLDTATTVKDTVMAVYTSAGGCSGPFMEVACSDDECGIRAALSVALTAGTTYYIVVWKFGTLTPAAGATAIQLRVSVPVVPPNDVCSGAEVIPSGGPFPCFTSVADTTLAGTSGDPPRASCQSQISRSVWYRFTPAHSAAYVISACHPETATTIYDTVMAVYAAPGGCGGALTEVACNDNACTFRSAITNRLSQGMTYYLVVWEAGNQTCTLGETSVQLRVMEIPVRITSASFVSNGVCRIGLTGMAGQPHAVEASADLINWLQIGTAVELGGGQFQFDDRNAGQFPRRLYRIVSR